MEDMMRTRQERPTGSAPALPPSPPPAPRWAIRAAQLTTLIVLPTGLWRLAMVCGFPSGYTEAGFVHSTPRAPSCGC